MTFHSRFLSLFLLLFVNLLSLHYLFRLILFIFILQAEMRARKFKKEVLNNEKKITLRLLKEDEKVLKKEKEAKLNFDYEQAHRDSKVSLFY